MGETTVLDHFFAQSHESSLSQICTCLLPPFIGIHSHQCGIPRDQPIRCSINIFKRLEIHEPIILVAFRIGISIEIIFCPMFKGKKVRTWDRCPYLSFILGRVGTDVQSHERLTYSMPPQAHQARFDPGIRIMVAFWTCINTKDTKRGLGYTATLASEQ